MAERPGGALKKRNQAGEEEEKEGALGQVTRPQQGRKGLSTPINMDTAGGVQSCRPDPSHTGGHCFPDSVTPLHASRHLTPSCALGLGPQRARVPPVTGGREGEAVRGEGQS